MCMRIYKIAKVVVSGILDKEFDYSFTGDMCVQKGMRVMVDFHGRKSIGIVVSVEKKTDIKDLKPIQEVLEDIPSITEENIEFASALSRIYPYSKSEFLFMMLPAYLKKNYHHRENVKGNRNLSETVCDKKNFSAATSDDNRVTGMIQRSSRFTFIRRASFYERYCVWKDAVKDKLKEGSVLICFPQISYLNEVKKNMEKDFPLSPVVISSQQSEKELFMHWMETRRNALVIGTRMAAFYYPCDVRLIIVEEENSPYYFQEEKPYYHLLPVVFSLSQLKGIDVVLSGDYPTLDTYKAISEKKVFLDDCGEEKKKIKLINIDGYKKRSLVPPLIEELLRKNIEASKKILIVWNKKWFGAVIACTMCGYIFKCMRCAVSLRFSLKKNKGICPCCGGQYDVPEICAQCNSGYVKSYGGGIEKLEMTLKRIFPEVKINNGEEQNPQTQVVISTSKVISFLYDKKKFDVGFLLDADALVSHSDYDTSFNAFLYIKKISSLCENTLYVCARNTDHFLFAKLYSDWCDFYDHELGVRRELSLPPFGCIAKIILRAEDENIVLTKADDLYNRFAIKNLEVYGPFQEYPFKLRGKFRYSLVIKSKQNDFLQSTIKEECKSIRQGKVKIALIIK